MMTSMHRTVRAPVALLALGGLVAGCGPAPSVSPTSTLEPSTGVPSTSPAPSAAGNAPMGAVLQVVADQLRLRDDAGVDGGVVAVLERGAFVRVASEPVDVDGFTWREVVDIANRTGWAADGDGTDAWLAPIDPTHGAPVIFSFGYGCDVVGPVNPPTVTVLDDGRVVAIDDFRGSVWWVRRLSDAGMRRVREDILGSPHLQASAEFLPRLRAGVGDPPGHGACSFEFTIPKDPDAIVVTSMSWFGDEEEAAFYEPAPERRALDHLARNLMAIDDALGEDAWQPAPRLPYAADSYQLWIGSDPGAGPSAGPSIDSAALGIGDVRSFGAPAGSGRCGAVSREQAFELARVLNAAGAVDPVQLNLVTFTGAQIDGISSTIVLAPTTPDGQPGCDAFSF
jgi:hypothetical protein